MNERRAIRRGMNMSANENAAGGSGRGWGGFIVKAGLWIIGGVLALALLFSASPFFTIDEGEAGVVLRLGAVQRVAEPGFNTKLPFIDSVVTLSTRTERRIYENLQSYSRDVQEAAIQLSVNYRINPDKVADVYAKFGTGYAERMIDPIVPERLKEIFGQYQATTVVSERTKLGEEVEAAIKRSVPDDILIESVQIENIDFSEAYEAAIEAVAQAEAEVRKVRNELEREKFEAEKRVVQAQAEANSLTARSKAQADAIRLQADADAYATRLRGDAEASAISARTKALADNPGYVNLIAAERWNGILPTTQVPGSAVPFISLPTGNALPAQ
jgi:regulator of protease activity HflC (stomatin/prohibitin superfamily)